MIKDNAMAYGKDIGATDYYTIKLIMLMAAYLGFMKHITQTEI
jgi:hypothetical protein